MSPLCSVAVAVEAAAVTGSLLLFIVAPLHVFARPVTYAFDIAATANKAALWTVILADVAPADVFNPKHLHHSQLSIIALQLKIAHYREIPSNISRYLQISPITFKKLRYPRIS